MTIQVKERKKERPFYSPSNHANGRAVGEMVIVILCEFSKHLHDRREPTEATARALTSYSIRPGIQRVAPRKHTEPRDGRWDSRPSLQLFVGRSQTEPLRFVLH